MKDDLIKCLVKKPGETIKYGVIPNTLEAFQEAVEGYIECVTIRPDLVMIVNEEGKLRGLPYNFTLFGYDEIVGTALFVGVDGEEFANCPLETKDLLDALVDYQEEHYGKDN